MDCKNRANLLPFLARVQIGQRRSQKSGSNTMDLLVILDDQPSGSGAKGSPHRTPSCVGTEVTPASPRLARS
jgi:hypothetical protein